MYHYILLLSLILKNMIQTPHCETSWLNSFVSVGCFSHCWICIVFKLCTLLFSLYFLFYSLSWGTWHCSEPGTLVIVITGHRLGLAVDLWMRLHWVSAAGRVLSLSWFSDGHLSQRSRWDQVSAQSWWYVLVITTGTEVAVGLSWDWSVSLAWRRGNRPRQALSKVVNFISQTKKTTEESSKQSPDGS